MFQQADLKKKIKWNRYNIKVLPLRQGILSLVWWETPELQMWKIIKDCICLPAQNKLPDWSSCHKDNLFLSVLIGWYSATQGDNLCLLSADQYSLVRYYIKNMGKLECLRGELSAYACERETWNHVVWETENLGGLVLKNTLNVCRAVTWSKDQLELLRWLRRANWGQRHEGCKESLCHTNIAHIF